MLGMTRPVPDWLFLSMFCVVYVFLALLGYTGFYASDDTHYLTAIREIGSGELIGPGDILMAGLRLAVTVPAGLIYFLSRGDLTLVTASFILYGLGLIVLAYWLGKHLHNRRVALIAAFLVSTSGLLAVYGGTVLPDVVLAFWLMAALCAVAAASSAQMKGTRYVLGLFVAAGIFLGLCYMSKSVGILAIAPVAAITIWTIRPSGRAMLGVAALLVGLGLILAVEAVVVPFVAEEGLTRLAQPARMAADYRLLAIDTGRLEVTDRLRTAYLYLIPTFDGFLWPFVVAGLIYPLLACRALLVWLTFWTLVLYRLVGSVSIDTYAPPALQARYFLFALPLGAIMASYCMDGALNLVGKARPLRNGLGSTIITGSLLFLAAAWLWTGVTAAARHAGTLFFAELVPTFKRAVVEAQQTCGDCPIVVSPPLSKRLGPLLEFGEHFPSQLRFVQSATSRKGDVAWDASFTPAVKPLPEPPLLFLDSSYDPVPTGELAEVMERAFRSPVSIRTLRRVHPLSRPVRDATFVQRAVFDEAATPEYDTSSVYAVEIRQVDLSDAAVPGNGGRLLLDLNADLPTLVPLTEHGVSVLQAESGWTVHWNLPEGVGEFYLQLFDGRSWKSAPKAGRSHLGPGSIKIRVELVVDGVKDAAPITLFAYLYQRNEVLNWESASTEATSSEAQLAVTVSADQSPDAFKVRIRFRPSTPAGNIVLRSLRVFDAGAEES